MNSGWPYYGFSMWRGIVKINPSIEVVVSDVAKRHGLTFSHLKSKSHKPHVVHAKWHAMAVLQETGRTISGIARYFKTDRSVIQYGLNKHRQLLESNNYGN